MSSSERSWQRSLHLPGSRAPFLTRVKLRNYRSIETCDVELGPLTFLVGPNGSGKSNFLDALRLITDALRTSLDHALRDRGGVHEVRRRSSGHPTNFGVRIDFQLPSGESGHFAFGVGARSHGDYVVQNEECAVGSASYRVREGAVVVKPAQVAPPASTDRLYLVNAAGLPEFRPVFDLLSNMGFYNLNPDQLRALQPPDKGELLARDGFNLSSVLERLEKQDNGTTKQRIEEYLSRIVPSLQGVDPKRVGHMETLEFRQSVEGAKDPWRFPAINMSDGTLRALGVLVALFQARAEHRVPLVGIEEPEIALHPAAAGILRDALRDGSQHAQVIVTSHSPELLDDPSIRAEEVISVTSTQGKTLIARVDEATRSVIRDRLYTAGELLKANQLVPDLDAVPEPKQMQLWERED
ncbi:AAA family ATPase [Corallococcus macrosporus]|uniref:Chromosome segregation protein SMC n=1 Tax=Corallococcus macrosporus DSM 14697 TaxID=1189310 RepID=A0A250K537_9BACT|nr:AAA family ATPase [Corallococcus macrosporus]ATB51108.1 chromosome segregation protein SMC [Corallococcus macrosporus DSM 14697]